MLATIYAVFLVLVCAAWFFLLPDPTERDALDEGVERRLDMPCRVVRLTLVALVGAAPLIPLEAVMWVCFGASLVCLAAFGAFLHARPRIASSADGARAPLPGNEPAKLSDADEVAVSVRRGAL